MNAALTTLQTRRLPGGVTESETYKILTSKDCANSSHVFQLAETSYNLHGHNMKLHCVIRRFPLLHSFSKAGDSFVLVEEDVMKMHPYP